MSEMLSAHLLFIEWRNGHRDYWYYRHQENAEAALRQWALQFSVACHLQKVTVIEGFTDFRD